VVATMRRVLGEEGYRVRDADIRVPRRLAAVAELADRVLQNRDLYSSQLHVLGELGRTIRCDITRTVDVLGYDPQVGLVEGMRRSVRWCARQGIDIAPRARERRHAEVGE